VARVSPSGSGAARRKPRRPRAADSSGGFSDRRQSREAKSARATFGHGAHPEPAPRARAAPARNSSAAPRHIVAYAVFGPRSSVLGPQCSAFGPRASVPRKVANPSHRPRPSPARRRRRRARHRPRARPPNRHEQDRQRSIRIDQRAAESPRYHSGVRAPDRTIRDVLRRRPLLSGRHESVAAAGAQKEQQHDRKHDAKPGRRDREHRPQQPDRRERGQT